MDGKMEALWGQIEAVFESVCEALIKHATPDLWARTDRPRKNLRWSNNRCLVHASWRSATGPCTLRVADCGLGPGCI